MVLINPPTNPHVGGFWWVSGSISGCVSGSWEVGDDGLGCGSSSAKTDLKKFI